MTSIYYFAAWTDCGCLLGCSHEHGTVGEAVACFSCAGGYVVAVENGVLRALTTKEELRLVRLTAIGQQPLKPSTMTPLAMQ